MEEAIRPRAQFQRVAREIRGQIGDGIYPVGSRLPSIAALAAEFESSHMTIKQALGELSHEGVIASRRGVLAEVVAVPSVDPPSSVADRLARVESDLRSLEDRIAAIEDHGSHPSRLGTSSP